MKVVIGADHAGYVAKEPIKALLESKGHEVVDVESVIKRKATHSTRCGFT